MLRFSLCTSGADDKKCWSMNYVTRRICALEQSSVNISSVYSNALQTYKKVWYKNKRREEFLMTNSAHVEICDQMNQSTLRINDLQRDDSAEYKSRFHKPRQNKTHQHKPHQHNESWKQLDLPGVTLVVTGNSVQSQILFIPWLILTSFKFSIHPSLCYQTVQDHISHHLKSI